MNFLKNYKGKKVLITGHTGFKGAWLAQILIDLGADVTGYALEPYYERGLYNELLLSEKCNSIIADIRNHEKLEKCIIDFQPDFIFHLAAQSLVLTSYQDPIETYDVNVMGTANLLNSVRKLNHRCSVVVITTDKVYKNNEWEYPYRENDPLGGYDPYSSSKACCEIAVASFRDSFFNLNDIADHNKCISSARAGNVIGGGDFSDNRLIPDLVKSLEANETLVLRSPKAVRPWQHVLEPLFFYLKLAVLQLTDPRKFCGEYNIGPENEDTLTVEELVQIAIDVFGKGQYECTGEQLVHEATTLKLDISKSKKILNWSPLYNSREAIQKTIKWYESKDKIKITKLQIEEFIREF